MLELDDLPAPGELTELLRQAIIANEPAVVHNREGHPVAVLVPWEVFAALRPAPSRPVAPEALTPEEERQAREIAAALRARGVAARGDPQAPSEAVKADPAWQKRWDDLLAKFRSVYPPGTPPEEIEADIAAAAEEVRQERLARRR
jgi:hypothetical protein